MVVALSFLLEEERRSADEDEAAKLLLLLRFSSVLLFPDECINKFVARIQLTKPGSEWSTEGR